MKILTRILSVFLIATSVYAGSNIYFYGTEIPWTGLNKAKIDIDKQDKIQLMFLLENSAKNSRKYAKSAAFFEAIRILINSDKKLDAMQLSSSLSLYKEEPIKLAQEISKELYDILNQNKLLMSSDKWKDAFTAKGNWEPFRKYAAWLK